MTPEKAARTSSGRASTSPLSPTSSQSKCAPRTSVRARSVYAFQSLFFTR